MLVVLEGCDCSGKSTLAKSLAEVLNAEINLTLAQNDNATAEKRYEAGAISKIAVYDSQAALYEAQKALEAALGEFWQSYFGLREAAGGIE
jgi:thymidylate kinase